jgi:hypothetical protein
LFDEFEDFAVALPFPVSPTGFDCFGSVWGVSLPVATGGASEYWTPLESSA